jgi:uncharacterized protein YjiS (DUF1127 family)
MIMSATFGAPAAVGERRRAQAKCLVASVRLWWVAHLTRRMERVAMVQLQAMSDRELKGIGLTRSEIEQAVKGEFKHWPLIGHY